MSDSVGQRNAQALDHAIVHERRRTDALLADLAGLRASVESLRAEIETLRKLVYIQRAGTGPTVK